MFRTSSVFQREFQNVGNRDCFDFGQNLNGIA